MWTLSESLSFIWEKVWLLTQFVFDIPLGRLNDIYGDYKYTYWACGIILIISGIYLFIGMGINYRLLAKEQKAEKQQIKENKEEETSIDAAEKPKEVTDVAESPEQKGIEGSPKEEESPVWTCEAEEQMEQLTTQDILRFSVVLWSSSGAQCKYWTFVWEPYQGFIDGICVSLLMSSLN